MLIITVFTTIKLAPECSGIDCYLKVPSIEKYKKIAKNQAPVSLGGEITCARMLLIASFGNLLLEGSHGLQPVRPTEPTTPLVRTLLLFAISSTDHLATYLPQNTTFSGVVIRWGCSKHTITTLIYPDLVPVPKTEPRSQVPYARTRQMVPPSSTNNKYITLFMHGEPSHISQNGHFFEPYSNANLTAALHTGRLIDNRMPSQPTGISN